LAIYHLSMKPISRASGRSSVAAAAYRAYQAPQGSRRSVRKIKVFAPRFCSEDRGGFEKAAVGFKLLGVALYDANVIVRLMTSAPTTFRTLWWRSF
jgi:hypothetical protein